MGMSFPLIIAVVIILALVVAIISVFNSLIRSRNQAKNAFSDIDVQLKRRWDLVPNLVEVVKGYATHESKVFEEVAAARASALSLNNAGSPAKEAEADQALTGALKSLFAVAENYPELRASENFAQLQSELSSIESDIQSARRYYNATVREFNTAVQTFPTNMVAGMLGFPVMEFFGADAQEREAVKVSI
jgi:LemA protein